MIEKPDLRLVSNNSKKRGESEKKETTKPTTLWNKFNDEPWRRDMREIPGQLDASPAIQREIQHQKNLIKNSVESFKDEHDKRIGKLEKILLEIKSVAESPEISKNRKIKNSLDEQMRYNDVLFPSLRQTYETYEEFTEEAKFTVEAQEIRTSLLKNIDEAIDSLNKLLESAKKAKDFYSIKNEGQ